MTDAQKALEALENWVRDPNRMIMPYGELTAAEIDLCDATETIRTALENAAKVDGLVEALREIIADCECDYPPSPMVMRHTAIDALSHFESEKKGGV